MNKKITVSVGIPAYNEEKNIATILRNILSQKREGWVLKEILIYSDGSSDNTVANARSVKNLLVTVVDEKSRKGKVARVQKIFQVLQGDIFVMFDGDVKIYSKSVINNFVKEFTKNPTAMLVGGNPKALLPKTFIERGVYATFKVFYASRLAIRNGNNLFSSCGSCYAIRKEFARSIHFPRIKNEDTFLYFLCKSKRYTFHFAKDAIIYYKLPNTLPDYLSQIFRSNPEAVTLSLEKHFGRLVKEEYDRGKLFYVKHVLRAFFEDPIPTSFIILVNLITKPLFSFVSKPNILTWESVKTTKII